MAKLFAPPAEDAYLDERTELIGEIGSAALLARDEAEGFWPPELSTDRDAPAMLWVDEYSCIGCRWCACVARNTFKVSDEYGTVRRDQGFEPQTSSRPSSAHLDYKTSADLHSKSDPGFLPSLRCAPRRGTGHGHAARGRPGRRH